MNTYSHIPVLLKEVILALDPKPGEKFIDATLGGGGYAKAILKKVQPAGKVLAIDIDEEAIKNFKNQDPRFKNQIIAVHGNFRDIDKIIKHHDFPAPDGIVADIGLSSYQLDNAGRGISFQKREILDMKFDKNGKGPDAKYILNIYEESRLLKIFRDYGEEKYSRQIARKIHESRSKNYELRYTDELYKVIQDALPKPVRHKADDCARRIFQALRIEVNRELQNLEEFIPKAFELLNSGGRLAIVSFHSLEDRIVKHAFQTLAQGCVCPADFPICVCRQTPKAEILNKKPIVATLDELKKNSRSKSAKLRVIKKII